MVATMTRAILIAACLLAAGIACGLLIFHIFALPALERAAFYGDYRHLTQRLDRGDDPNRRTSYVPLKLSNMTPLKWAVRGKQPDSIRLLLERGASLENQSWPLLLISVWFDCPECARVLLEHGADPNATSASTSILRKTLDQQNSRLAIELIRAGADVQEGDLDAIFAYLRIQRFSVDDFYDVVKVLLARGLSPDSEVFSKTASRGTMLMYAAQWASPETVELLLCTGADVGITDAQGRTAFDYAQARTDGSAERVTSLLARQVADE